MGKNEELKQAKERFLKKYETSPWDKEKAISNSIGAAVKHNKIYPSNKFPINLRKKVKSSWINFLRNLDEKVTETTSEEEYLLLIEELKKHLCISFRESGAQDNFIKICHSQKSISVYLKYRWCMGRIEPIHCPVDSIILKKIDWKGASWTSVDNINDHVRMIEAIRLFVQKENPELSIAEWELLNF